MNKFVIKNRYDSRNDPRLSPLVWIPAILAAVLLGGCVSPQIVKPPPPTVDLRALSSLKLVVIDSVLTPYSKAGLPEFEGLLQGKLQSLGYRIVKTNAQMVLNVNVHEFSPGDRELRTLISFGAGRAVLKYTATFKDASGHLLAKLEGGKAYNGLELVDNPTFKSDESTCMGLISYSVSQIGDFIENDWKEYNYE